MTFLWKSFTTFCSSFFGWSGQAFYNFRIHDQEIGRRRHLRTHLLSEFQLRRREKFLYTGVESMLEK